MYFLWFINTCYVQKSYSMFKRGLPSVHSTYLNMCLLDFTKFLKLYEHIHTFIHFQVRWDLIITLSNLLLLLGDFNICFSFFKLKRHRRAVLKSSAQYPRVDIVSEWGHAPHFSFA